MPTRRGFLARLAGAALGLTLAAKLPGIASAPPRLAEPEPTSITVDTDYHAFFKVGDVVQLGDDPTKLLVTVVSSSAVHFERLHA